MRATRGRSGAGILAGTAVLVVATNAWAIPLDPNGGHLWINDRIILNIAQGQCVFDKLVGPLGSLVDIDSATGGATIISSNPNYPGPYSLGIRWSVPLIRDVSSGPPLNLAMGEFGTADSTPLGYEIVDLENGGVVLLSGEILSSPFGNYDFMLTEKYTAPGQLVSVNGGGQGGQIGMTVTGGLLEPYYPPLAKMVIQSWIASPNPLNDFSQSLFTGGGGSVTITAVPEPSACTLLLVGTVCGLVRGRRRGR